MTKKTWLTIGGVIGIVGGCVALYLAGHSESAVAGLVAAAFVLIGAIGLFFAVGGTAKQAVEAYKASVADVTQAIEKK
jgi:uncharacterized membrane protein HdeD (DUF308 family)